MHMLLTSLMNLVTARAIVNEHLTRLRTLCRYIEIYDETIADVVDDDETAE